MNQDNRELAERFLNLLCAACCKARLYTGVSEPHSRWPAPFDEIRFWKGDDIYFAQFGRRDGGSALLGFFTHVRYTEREQRIYRTWCLEYPAGALRYISLPALHRELSRLAKYREEVSLRDDRFSPATTEQVLSASVFF